MSSLSEPRPAYRFNPYNPQNPIELLSQEKVPRCQSESAYECIPDNNAAATAAAAAAAAAAVAVAVRRYFTENGLHVVGDTSQKEVLNAHFLNATTNRPGSCKALMVGQLFQNPSTGISLSHNEENDPEVVKVIALLCHGMHCVGYAQVHKKYQVRGNKSNNFLLRVLVDFGEAQAEAAQVEGNSCHNEREEEDVLAEFLKPFEHVFYFFGGVLYKGESKAHLQQVLENAPQELQLTHKKPINLSLPTKKGSTRD